MSITHVFRDHAGYWAFQEIPGIGPVLAAIFVAEIGPVDRFTSAGHLGSWCGLTPRHRESDTTVRRGPITKQGNRLVRWALSRPPRSSAAIPGSQTNASHPDFGDFEPMRNLGSLQPSTRMVFAHRDFKATACPGQHLINKLADISF